MCDADELVTGLYLAGGAAVAPVKELFGAAVLEDDGGVDRRALGAIILADQGARRRLEAVVHPLVRAQVVSWLAATLTAARPPKLAIVEAALLVETGAFHDYDRLVVVTAPETARLARAIARGWPESRVRQVIRAQATDVERAVVADYLIVNDTDLAGLEQTAGELWASLLEDACLLAAGVPLPSRRPTL